MTRVKTIQYVPQTIDNMYIAEGPHLYRRAGSNHSRVNRLGYMRLLDAKRTPKIISRRCFRVVERTNDLP